MCIEKLKHIFLAIFETEMINKGLSYINEVKVGIPSEFYRRFKTAFYPHVAWYTDTNLFKVWNVGRLNRAPRWCFYRNFVDKPGTQWIFRYMIKFLNLRSVKNLYYLC